VSDYNSELLLAEDEIENGIFVTHDDIIKHFAHKEK
jgi:hypothetical protein